MTNHDRLFGATKIPFGGPPFGDTQNPRENNFYKNGLSCYPVYYHIYLPAKIRDVRGCLTNLWPKKLSRGHPTWDIYRIERFINS